MECSEIRTTFPCRTENTNPNDNFDLGTSFIMTSQMQKSHRVFDRAFGGKTYLNVDKKVTAALYNVTVTFKRLYKCIETTVRHQFLTSTTMLTSTQILKHSHAS